MTTKTKSLQLPRWDLESIYGGLEAEDYRAAVRELDALLADLEEYLDRHQVRRLAVAPSQLKPEHETTLVGLVELVNRSDRLASTIDCFVFGHYSTDSRDPIAQREMTRVDLQATRREKALVRVQGWIGSLSGVLAELLDHQPTLAPYRFHLELLAEESRFLMDENLEQLASELSVDGARAFNKLQSALCSQLKVPFARNGASDQLPIAMVRNLGFDPDPDVRERAYHAEIGGWRSISTPVATALNSIKGTALTLARRRGRSSVLEESLHQNRIDQATLDALMGSLEGAFPMFRRYLKSKARKLGKQRLAWWDLFAPVGTSHATFTWSQARDFIAEQFATFSPDLAAFAVHAIDHRWIDAEPREGKQGGGFCMPILGREESRILVNFDGSMEQLFTLAHELGHAFHNHCQKGLEPLRRGTPSTLAETASIFCETLVSEAAMRSAPDATRLAILESQLTGATQVCLDISSRFRFESEVFGRRATDSLSADELCQLMLAAQGETYADAIETSTYHPYMWLLKPHYYSPGGHFYNYPYAFGHLFGLGLYAVYQQEGAPFVARYQELLRDTGQNQAKPLAARFGIDLTRPEFWQESLRFVERQVETYEALELGS